MVRINRPIRKGRDLPLATTIFFNEYHPPQTATCRLLPLGDMVGPIAILQCTEFPSPIAFIRELKKQVRVSLLARGEG
jgi:hypothetical protein